MPQQPLGYQAASHPPAKPKWGPLAQGAIVLLLYPFCLLANVMSVSALETQGASIGPVPRLAMKGFLWGSIIYPVVYLVAAATSVFLASNDRPVGARRVAQAPLIYLIGLLLCFVTALIAGA